MMMMYGPTDRRAVKSAISEGRTSTRRKRGREAWLVLAARGGKAALSPIAWQCVTQMEQRNSAGFCSAALPSMNTVVKVMGHQSQFAT